MYHTRHIPAQLERTESNEPVVAQRNVVLAALRLRERKLPQGLLIESRVCWMLARILRKVPDASSLISPLGRTHRRIAACNPENRPATRNAPPAAGILSASSGIAASTSPRFPAATRVQKFRRLQHSFWPFSRASHAAGSASAPNPARAPTAAIREPQ